MSLTSAVLPLLVAKERAVESMKMPPLVLCLTAISFFAAMTLRFGVMMIAVSGIATLGTMGIPEITTIVSFAIISLKQKTLSVLILAA
jgi:hypothetical protein